ncbi:MAG: hypothetical protein P8L72_03430 [Flavobacteriaceae bacterium]|nr:hypothetical protein [Flavobacteriaceae bacterium]
MVLVYTHTITPRVRYVFKHIFVRLLGVPIDFTSALDVFVAFSGPKFSYTKQPLGNEFFIQSHSLLFGHGVETLDITTDDWDELPIFFGSGSDSSIPFDLFAASFYLLSRYEEYVPHRKDFLGRFIATDSLALEKGFLEIPLVDLWVQRFGAIFKKQFPDISFSNRSFQLQTAMEVPVAFQFKGKGLIRSLAGFFKDIFKFNFISVFKIIGVLLSLQTDPADTFTEWIAVHTALKIPTQCFFLFTNLSHYDRNISFFNTPFLERIKEVADYIPVSLLASHQSTENNDLIKIESNRLQALIHKQSGSIRQHMICLSYPTVYRNFAQEGYLNDYSFQYNEKAGFRASTCTPFYFYDLESESQTPLKIHPIALTEYHLKRTKSTRKARQLMERITQNVKKAKGPLTIVFTNASFKESVFSTPWKTLLIKYLRKHGV